MRLGEFAKNAALLVVRCSCDTRNGGEEGRVAALRGPCGADDGALADPRARRHGISLFEPGARVSSRSRSCAFALGHEVDVADVREELRQSHPYERDDIGDADHRIGGRIRGANT